MSAVLTLIVVLAVVAAVVWLVRRHNADSAAALADAQAESRRWVERLGGQVLALTGTDDPSRQALADAAERYTAAGSQMEQARTAAQCRQVTETAYEGLYYIRAARTAMGMDPGPELPPLPTDRNSHYYPGGTVAGRPVPRGWYSEPWWKPALVAGAWGVGSALLFTSLFSGMAGADQAAYADGAALDDPGFDGGADGGFDGADQGGFEGGGLFDNDSDFGGDFF